MFQITILVLLCLTVGGLALNLNAFSAKSTTAIKKELLELSNKVQRGLIETEQERAKILQLFEQLEKKNPTKEPLKSPKINAIWSLDYTTSDSILGRGGAKRVGKILQKIDAVNLKGENSEVRNYFGLNVPVSVTADFSPMSKSKVAVQFKKFRIGPIRFDAPSSFKGELDTTYLDDNVRLSRGDKGNIFVLTRYSDLK